MAHWIETYPHTVYASVLLKDNKIMKWKIGDRRWEYTMQMTRKLKLPFNMDDYAGETVQSIGFEVNNSDEHNHAFAVFAKEWFKNWKVHEDHEGGPAYEEHIDYWQKARELLSESNCLRRHYACVIVQNDNIIATGYNVSLEGCTECARTEINHNSGDYSKCGSIHAEQMCLIRAKENSLEGAELYLVCDKDSDPTPCPICSRMLNWAGVKQVREVRE